MSCVLCLISVLRPRACAMSYKETVVEVTAISGEIASCLPRRISRRSRDLGAGLERSSAVSMIAVRTVGLGYAAGG